VRPDCFYEESEIFAMVESFAIIPEEDYGPSVARYLLPIWKSQILDELAVDFDVESQGDGSSRQYLWTVSGDVESQWQDFEYSGVVATYMSCLKNGPDTSLAAIELTVGMWQNGALATRSSEDIMTVMGCLNHVRIGEGKSSLRRIKTLQCSDIKLSDAMARHNNEIIDTFDSIVEQWK